MTIAILACIVAATVITFLAPALVAGLAFYLGGILIALVLAGVLVGLGVPLRWWRA